MAWRTISWAGTRWAAEPALRRAACLRSILSSRAPTFVFRDGFERAEKLADLFPRDFSRWQGWQREAGAGATTNDVSLTIERTIHNRVQVGLAANGNRTHPQTLFVDDIVRSNRSLE